MDARLRGWVRMNKKNYKLLVPKLRFSEFRNTGEWNEITLSDVLYEHGNKSTGKEEVYSVSVHKGLVNQIEHLGRSFAAASTDHYNRVLPGDIVYTKSPTGDFPFGIIKQSKIDFSVIVSPLYGVFSPETIVLGIILDAYFESPANTKVYLEPLVQKGAKNTINIKNSKFLSGSMILPLDKDEQQKIADCLNSLDELITSEDKKLDFLKAHKKGLMQKLFPKEGEIVPKLRFPEFQGSGEWVKQKLSNLLRKLTIPVEVDPDEVYQEIGIRSHGKGIFHKEPVCGKELGNKRVFWVEDNAFIVNIVFAWELAVATTKETEKGMIASHRFPMYKASKNKASVRFIKYFFLTEKGKELLLIASPGGAGRNKTLGQKEFGNLDFLVPVLTEEQKKIADCLTSLDDLITAQTQKINTLKIHKKGLMQGLFPSVDEVGV